MTGGLPEWSVLLPLAAAMLATGGIAGVIAGLLGVGGGIVIVPVLFHIFTALDVAEAVRMHVAVGTSLATIIPTSISSARAHYRRGSVDADLLRSWGLAIFVGVLAGSALSGVAGGPVLTGVFAGVALIVAANMAFRPDGWTVRESLPRPPVKQLVAFLVGGFSTMMGIGGGTLSVPILTACSFPIRRAVGTAAAIGLIIAVPGTIGFVALGLGVPERPPGSLGYVNLVGFALIVPATILTAPLGAKIAHTINTGLLRKAFALFLFATALRMIYSLTT